MAETSTPTSNTPKKPASRAANASRKRSRNRKPTGNARAAAPAAKAAAPTAAQEDWRALNRIVSRYMAGHPNASIGETSVGELLAYAEQKRPKTMTAGGGNGD